MDFYYYIHARKCIFGNVAQSVEQHPFKVMVLGSIPSVPTKDIFQKLLFRSFFIPLQRQSPEIVL